MPHKVFELHAIKTYTHINLVEALYIKRKHTNKSINTWIHMEITVNIYMQRTGSTHKFTDSYKHT